MPLPAEAEKVPVPKTAPGCASYRSYRGIGRPVNYAEARACAWQERLAQKANLGQNPDAPYSWVVGGSLILADIYFNGAGVKRNVPLAIRLGCETENSMAMSLLPDNADLNSAPPADKPFELCDEAGTTFTMNFCIAYESEIKDDRRSRYYNSLEPSMIPGQKVAFEKLLTAENAYVEAHASEVDQGGTIRNIRTNGSQDILNDLFHTEVNHFEGKKWPALSDHQITTADALLQGEYEKTLHRLRTRPEEDTYEGAVTAEHVADVEKAWESYRDAWDEFARLRYPTAAAAIRAEIILDRYRLLKTIS